MKKFILFTTILIIVILSIIICINSKQLIQSMRLNTHRFLAVMILKMWISI